MTDQQLIELIKYCPDLNEEQKILYGFLIERNFSEDDAKKVRETILELIEEKINLKNLKEYKEQSENLYTALEAAAKIKSMQDIAKKAEGDYNNLALKLEQEQVKRIKFQAGLE